MCRVTVKKYDNKREADEVSGQIMYYYVRVAYKRESFSILCFLVAGIATKFTLITGFKSKPP